MLSQTAHQRVLFGVCGPPGCTSRVSRLPAACHSFHLALPSPPQPCSWPGRTHSLPLHALAMSVVKPELGLQPDSFPAGLLWCSPGATRHLRTRPLRQVVMARGPSPSHAAWRLPAWCASPFALRPLLPRLPALAQQEAAAAADRATNKRKRQEFEAKLASWDGELKTQSRFRLGRDELTAVMPPAQADCRIRGHEFYPKRFNKDGRCRKGFHNMVGGGKQLPWGGHDSYLRTCKVCGHVEFVPES